MCSREQRVGSELTPVIFSYFVPFVFLWRWQNVRFMLGFLSETAKTMPRHKVGGRREKNPSLPPYHPATSPLPLSHIPSHPPVWAAQQTGLSAKAQRKVSHEIRIARCLGLVPFTSIGRPPYRFQRSRVMNEPGGEGYGGSSRPPTPSLYGQRRTPSPVRNRRLDSSWDSTSLAKRNDSRGSQP